MSDVFEPPQSASTSSSARIVLLVLCLSLGAVGTLMTCYTGFALTMMQAMGDKLMINPEQAKVLADAQAAQAWWLMPLTGVQLVLKLGLSLGLTVGAVQALRKQASGPAILMPVLVFGMVFELLSAAFGAANTFLQREAMVAQFGASMAADPNMPTHIAEAAGSAFGVIMVGTMLFMLVWAMVKAGIYGLTRRTLSAELG